MPDHKNMQIGDEVMEGNGMVKESGGIHSLKVRILLIINISVLLATIVNLAVVIPLTRNNMLSVNKNYIFDMAKSYGKTIQLLYDRVGDEMYKDGTVEAILKGASIAGIDTSYVYLVDRQGIMRYHPTEQGQPVNNDVVADLVREMAGGIKPPAEVVRYEIDGDARFTGYYISDRMNFILVFTAAENEILAPMYGMIKQSIFGAVITLIACSLLAFVSIIRALKPIALITKVIEKLGELDLTTDDTQRALCKRRDETGEMSRAITKLTDKLAIVLGDLQKQSLYLMEAAQSLDKNTQETINSVSQVEQAVGDIASGATSQADETQTATENVVAMGDMINTTSSEVTTLNGKSQGIADASENATRILAELGDINRKAVDAVHIIYKQTNTTNESAQKIREATTLISAIAEETNLLSLNASIEAARAGEQGRGFAVVANQIQKLAEQSNQSANQIEQIIASLLGDTATAVRTVNEVQEIMDEQNNKVISASTIVSKVKREIDDTLAGVQNIADATQEMQNARNTVIDVVQNLTAIAEENAASTQETSASVTEIASIIEDIANNASSLKDIAGLLDADMRQFKIG